MADKIQKHYVEEDIQALFIGWDLTNWKEKLETIAEEMTLFSNLLLLLEASPKKGRSSYTNLFEKIALFKSMNSEFDKNLIAYNLQLEGLKECEDLQCETYFLNGHTHFKEKIEAYFSEYRNLKKTLFSKINNGIRAAAQN